MDIQDGIRAYEEGNHPLALECFRALAEQGDGQAQAYLGEMLDCGFDGDERIEEGLSWIRKAAEQGIARAQLELWRISLTRSRSDLDPDECLAGLLNAAEQGLCQAQEALASAYLEGIRTNRDDAAGLHWLRTAAGNESDFHGCLRARARLAEIYRSGNHARRDPAEALHWLQHAADLGDPQAAYRLGRAYLNGELVAPDGAEAARWLEIAASDDEQIEETKDAAYLLGRIHLEGNGVPADEAQAARWFCRGVVKDHDDCIAAFAKLYRRGIHPPEEECEAVAWYRMAVEEKDPTLQKRLGLRAKDAPEPVHRSQLVMLSGLAGLLFCGWYVLVTVIADSGSGTDSVNWVTLVIVVVNGLYLGGWLSRIEYPCDRLSRVTGAPFPVVLWERDFPTDTRWFDYYGPFTLVAPLLNRVLAALAAAALLLALPSGYAAAYFFVLILAAGFMGVRERRSSPGSGRESS